MATVDAPSQGVSSPQVLGNFRILLILQTSSPKTSANRWYLCMSCLDNAPLLTVAVKPRYLLDLCWPQLKTSERRMWPRMWPGQSCLRHRCRMCDWTPLQHPATAFVSQTPHSAVPRKIPILDGEWGMAFRLADYLVSLWELQNTAPAWKMAPAQHKTFPEGKVNIWEECT